ncbi:hypothetical protein BK126_05255 [Paenibacillus sp. FSL H7-0326]|uniref:hypothetical protein n=1 Tax=Paenibacillus sp. FSL H7-0326 TaxID=1921144 RepID=UPI00096E2006|nr:hypothetical protein [Paenibacillus sp. FSL H7-0326]OMC71487.1 hypothetical protein BK126_05255 [Paenibacillus sp. FSL H7-0326]
MLKAGLNPVDILSNQGSCCVDIVHQKDISHTTAYSVNLFEAMEQVDDEELDVFLIYRKYTVPEDHADLGTGAYDFAETYSYIQQMGNVRNAIVQNVGASPDKFRSIINDLYVLK